MMLVRTDYAKCHTPEAPLKVIRTVRTDKFTYIQAKCPLDTCSVQFVGKFDNVTGKPVKKFRVKHGRRTNESIIEADPENA